MSSEPTTRGRVLEAALDLVTTTVGPISMSAIAKAAGLSRQALYLLFSDRADLFVGLLRYADARRGLVDELKTIRAAPSGVEALLALVDLQARLNPGYRPLFDAFEVLRRQDDAAERAWHDRAWHRLEGCRAIVARLSTEGRLRAGLDREVAADLVWTLTSSACWNDLVVHRGWTAAQYRRHISETLFSALMATPSDNGPVGGLAPEG